MNPPSGLSGAQPPSPKLRQPFRPRSAMTARVPAPRSALGSHNDNLPSTPDSPSQSILPTPARVPKLKIKCATTPEARTRVMVKPKAGGPQASAAKSRIGRPREEDVWGDGRSVDHAAVLDTLEPPPVLDASENVLVSIRVRPHNAAELRADTDSAWFMPTYDNRLLKLNKGRDGLRDDREWLFDRILTPDTDNARVYATSARAHVQSALDGFNAVIFAYGQTASGKTFTLTGAPTNPGIIPLAISDLFAQIRSTPDREFLLRASYLELYNETIIDLLSESGQELTLTEGRKKGDVIINGLTQMGVRTEDEIRKLLRIGEERRKVGGTDWNQRSSRSHCVFRIVIESKGGASSGSATPARDRATRTSTLSIIDLAGSEKHTSSKERNAEGKHINQSLLTLKLVISKLADMASKRNVMHVPYRDSKLTRLLQPSLSGDARISVICTISPSPVNVAESISTLSFAQGLKRVLLSAQRKERFDPEALIQQYQNEIAELRALLREKEMGGLNSSRSERQKDQEMESRLTELKSLILNSGSLSGVNARGPQDTPVGRPLTPAKLKFPKIEIDKTAAALQEQVHSLETENARQKEEIERLKAELDRRPTNPDKRVLEQQDEINQLRMIADDYERHLREPSRKVREDVEKEWAAKFNKVEDQLWSKKQWADRLHHNLLDEKREKEHWRSKAQASESKVLAVFEWVNQALGEGGSDEDDDDDYDNTFTVSNSPDPFLAPLPQVQRDLDAFDDDFGVVGAATEKLATLTLNQSRLHRPRVSSKKLQSEFKDWFQGSLGRPPPHRLLRESLPPPLASLDDDEF